MELKNKTELKSYDIVLYDFTENGFDDYVLTGGREDSLNLHKYLTENKISLRDLPEGDDIGQRIVKYLFSNIDITSPQNGYNYLKEILFNDKSDKVEVEEQEPNIKEVEEFIVEEEPEDEELLDTIEEDEELLSVEETNFNEPLEYINPVEDSEFKKDILNTLNELPNSIVSKLGYVDVSPKVDSLKGLFRDEEILKELSSIKEEIRNIKESSSEKEEVIDKDFLDTKTLVYFDMLDKLKGDVIATAFKKMLVNAIQEKDKETLRLLTKFFELV